MSNYNEESKELADILKIRNGRARVEKRFCCTAESEKCQKVPKTQQ